MISGTRREHASTGGVSGGKTCGGDRTFGVNRATAVLHAVADRPLVNIRSDVIHILHGGASLASLNQLGR